MSLRRVSLLRLLTLSISMVFFSNLHAETWRIASLDWQPYSGSDLVNQGKSVNKLRRLLKKENIELIVDFFPWLRAQNYAKNKKYIGYFPAWPEEVKEGFIASSAVDWSYISVLSLLTSNIAWNGLDNLFKTNQIGIVQTYVYPDFIQRLIKKYPYSIANANDETSLVKMLSLKRFDAAITDPSVMFYYAKKNNIKVKIVKNNLQKKELVIAFRNDPENKKRIELFESILGNIHD